MQEPETVVHYYIQAADESGRLETLPRTAPVATYSFTIFAEKPPDGLLPPENVIISITEGYIYLEWDVVTGANSYKIYGSDNPYAEDWGSEIAVVDIEEYSEPVSQIKKFYRIVASSDTMPTIRSESSARRRN
ncbi:MAG: hypothetical protein K0B81_04090 [Candidatus Cloacimonetes bacterium]|nr:hypothetical protein [Candidatus Cloacimonadota bacterium]